VTDERRTIPEAFSVISAVIYHYLVFQIILPDGTQQNVFLFCNDFLCIYVLFSGHVARMGERRGIYRDLVGKPERNRPLGRPRHRWKNNIKMGLQEVECGGMDWIDLAQDRNRWWALENAVMNLRVPYSAGNFLTSCESVSFSYSME